MQKCFVFEAVSYQKSTHENYHQTTQYTIHTMVKSQAGVEQTQQSPQWKPLFWSWHKTLNPPARYTSSMTDRLTRVELEETQEKKQGHSTGTQYRDTHRDTVQGHSTGTHTGTQYRDTVLGHTQGHSTGTQYRDTVLGHSTGTQYRDTHRDTVQGHSIGTQYRDTTASTTVNSYVPLRSMNSNSDFPNCCCVSDIMLNLLYNDCVSSS